MDNFSFLKKRRIFLKVSRGIWREGHGSEEDPEVSEVKESSRRDCEGQSRRFVQAKIILGWLRSVTHHVQLRFPRRGRKYLRD
jgi:hypothetical protein